MLTRRHAIAALGTGLGAGALALRTQAASAAGKLGDDGLYQMDWYLESFLDLSEDLAAATAKGKRFAILWGLKGCPACKRMHQVHLQDPKIEAYIRDNFDILHLNHIGARDVTDFDGIKRGEKAFGDGLRNSLHADDPVLPRAGGGKDHRAGPRSRAHAGPAGARGISRDVPLRAREGLRDRAVSGLAEEAGLKATLQ